MMAPSIRPSYAPSAIHSVAGHSTSASIQERTRQLLGWTENNQVFTTADPSASTSMFIRKLSNSSTTSYRMSPYQKHRARRNSCSSSSTCSSDYSQPSPSNVQRYYSCPDSPESMDFPYSTRTPKDVQVFERVRRLLPVLPNDSNALQV
uniref:C4 n=1 Tax=Steinernema glaseri TaxID=37863 RepID=A0A1I7YDV6_9BILA